METFISVMGFACYVCLGFDALRQAHPNALDKMFLFISIMLAGYFVFFV